MVQSKTYKSNQLKGVKAALVKRFVLAAILISSAFSLFGQIVPQEKALTIAKNFYNSSLSQVNTLKSAKNISFAVARTEKITSNSELKSAKNIPAFFVINIGETDGFIIVAGDERVQPILGYSLNGSYNAEAIPEHIASFLNNYKNEISDMVLNTSSINLPIDKKWNELENGVTKSAEISNSFNLISTNWGQGKNYNEFCPEDPAMVCPSYNGHVPTGCVAVVMSQIMQYWSWPLSGSGSNCYTPAGNNEYGEQCANFATASYNYSGNADQVTESNNDVAQLIYHSAVSVKMNFSPSGSSTLSSTTVKAFVNNFNFSEKAEFVYRSAYSDTEWAELLRKHLDNGVPLYYRGDNEGKSAHAFICDGYDQEGRFHFNWGWDGRYNGFFAISAMAPITNYNYNSNQGAIINLFPANHDFSVDGLTSDKTTVIKGGNIIIAYNQVYNGSDFNGQDVTFSYWLSSDSIKGEDDIFLGQDITTLSSKNNLVNTTKSFTLPENPINDEYFILVVAKSNNNIKETDESNNLASLRITINNTDEEVARKSTIACSDALEPNNSDFEAFYLGEEAGYYNNGLCLSENDEDWFEFKLNSVTYFAKIAAGKNSSHGFYGVEFNFNSGSVEVVTFETEWITDTKIWLYDSELNLIAEDDNGGENPFARLMFRPSSSTTAASMFNENNFSVYPNPAKEKVYINTDIRFDKDITVTLMDMRGTLLEKKSFENITNTSEFSLDLTPYSDGQYIVGIYSADGAFVSKKIMKKSWI